MSDHYILVDRKPVPADLATWAAFFEKIENRRVAERVIGSFYVSTVFLGLDHRFGHEGPPLLFETMIFGAPDESPIADYQVRTSTWAQAEVAHEKALAMAATWKAG